MLSLNEKFKEINLTKYVESRLAFDKIENLGGNKSRVNPAPCCGHNGCFTIYDDTNTYHCFSCKSTGSVGDLLVATHGATDIKDAADKLGLNADYNDSKASPSNNIDKPETNSGNKLTDAIKRAATNHADRIAKRESYFLTRGLKADIITKYGLKIDGDKALLPGGIVKNIDTGDYMNPAGQTPPTLNVEYLQATGIVYVGEGVFDALSLEQLGQKAISINSVSNVPKFIEQLKESKTTCTIVSAFDNDDAGQKATEKLRDGCKALKIPFDVFKVHKYKDVNEWLVYDLKELEAAVARFTVSINAININRADCFDTFLATRKTPRNYISTGWGELDRALGGGLVADTYCIGGTPGAGKSAFVLQICQAISKAEIPVLYFSLELSEDEIDARNTSRLTYMNDNASFLTALKINMGNLDDDQWKILDGVTPEYKATFKNFHIDTCKRDRTVSYIAETATRHKIVTSQSPAVVVDYLQILQTSNSRQTDKQTIDDAITELKRLSNSLNMPVIIISSLNRAGYDKGDSMSGFKESGSIEYSAAVAMNIMPSKEVGKVQLESRRNGKPAPSIETELQIVKNRHYITGAVKFDFFGAGNYFKEKSLHDKIQRNN